MQQQEELLGLSRPALDLLKRHKRSACIAALLDMGFDEAAAASAADATGCDAERAAAILMDGGWAGGGATAAPVDVAREAQELVSLAEALLLPSPTLAVDQQVVASHGDPEAARGELQMAAAALSSRWEGSAAGHDSAPSLPSSQPDTPVPAAPLPPWAADAASAHSAPSPTAADSGQFEAAAAAGVLSLADFSSSLDQEHGSSPHPTAWQPPGQTGWGPASNSPIGNQQQQHQEQEQPLGRRAATPTGQAAPHVVPFGSPVAPPGSVTPLPPHLAGGVRPAFDDGFAAGLAAAVAMQQEQQKFDAGYQAGLAAAAAALQGGVSLSGPPPHQLPLTPGGSAHPLEASLGAAAATQQQPWQQEQDGGQYGSPCPLPHVGTESGQPQPAGVEDGQEEEVEDLLKLMGMA